jgi:hypothetical protein
MRLISALIAESRDDAHRALYMSITSDQLLNILVLVPLLFILNLGCAAAIRGRPDLFIARGAHVWLIGAQLVSFIGYLICIARHFKAIAPLIQRSHYATQEASLSNTR